jgi:hypothetical protein
MTEAKTNLHPSFCRTCATATCGSPFSAPETAASTSTTSVPALEDSPIFFEPCSLMLDPVPNCVDSLERMRTPTWIPLLSGRAHVFFAHGLCGFNHLVEPAGSLVMGRVSFC